MVPQGVKNVIFDFGAVILDIDGSRTINAFRALGVDEFDSFHEFLHSQGNQRLFIDIETGAISPSEFRDSIRKIAKKNLLDEAIDNAWNAMLVRYRKERLDLLQELKTKFRTFLLSNTNIIHWEHFTKMLQPFGYKGLHELFEKDYYSHVLGMRKPNDDIFMYVVKASNLNPEETLFLDDNLMNIEAAKRLGIHTIQITQTVDILNVFG